MSGIDRLPSGDVLVAPAGPGAVTTVGSPTDVTVDGGVSGHVVAPGGSAPTVAAGANNGTSPPGPTASGNDSRGSVGFGSGASPAAGAQVAVTFATPFSTPPTVVLTAQNAATQALGLFVAAVTANGFTISCGSAPGASQALGTYAASFAAIG